MLTLTLIRHGETVLNALRRYQGRIDPPLSDAGVAQASALAAVLGRDFGAAPAGHTPAAPPEVYSSDSGRALQTAALALPGIPVVLETRLRELDFGTFDGRTFEENLTAHGDRFRAWIDDPDGVRPPGGETLPELEARVADWLDALPRDGRVIAFTHGGPIHSIVARLLRIPFPATRRHGVAPGDALRLVVPANPVVPTPMPVRLTAPTAGGLRQRGARAGNVTAAPSADTRPASARPPIRLAPPQPRRER